MGDVAHAVHRVLGDHPGNVGDLGIGVGVDSKVETGHGVFKVRKEVLPERTDNCISWNKGFIKTEDVDSTNIRSKTVWLSTLRWSARTY